MPFFTRHQAKQAAFLAAMAFFLSTIEFLLPRPIPFLRIGLANIPLLLAVDLLGFAPFMLLLFIKVLGMNLLSGALFSYIALFSLLGTLSSGLVMWFLRKTAGSRISYIGLCTAGALASNGAQLLAARYIVFGQAAFYMLPMVAGFGLLSGLILGWFTNLFAGRSLWLAGFTDPDSAINPASLDKKTYTADEAASAQSPQSARRNRQKLKNDQRRERWLQAIPALPMATLGLTLIVLTLFISGTAAKAASFLLAIILSWLSGRRIRLINIIIVMAGIIAAHLFVPTGRVLYQLGRFVISEEALLKGIQKALVFESIIMYSRATISPGLRLPGRAGAFFAQAMRYYEEFLSGSSKIRARSFFEDVDRILCRVYYQQEL